MKTPSLKSRRFPSLRALALLALGSLYPATDFAQSPDIELSLVAMTGQPAPGTDYHFSTFAVPVISHDGTIGFGGSDFGGGGVWVQTKDGSLYGVALPGTDSPWTFPNSNPPKPFQYGVGGTLFYLGNYNRIVASGPEGLVFSDAGATPTIYLDPNTAPQLGTTIGSSLFPAFNQFRFQSGALAPTMYLQGPDLVHHVQALYRYENGTLTEIARGGDPSATGTTNSFDEQNPFPVFVASPQGDLVVHAIYYLDLSTYLNETGIYYDKGDGLKLLVRNGDPFPTNIASGPILLDGGGNGTDPQAPSISSAGRIVFKAYRHENGQPVQTFVLQGNKDTGELTALVRGGDTVTLEDGSEATIKSIQDRPVINEVGEVYYRALDGDLDALWRFRSGRNKRLMRAGDLAPGTDGATFAGPDRWVVNAEGRVAMLAELQFGTNPVVTPDNNLGLWMQDDVGGWALVARTGASLFGGNFGTITSIKFEANGFDINVNHAHYATGNDEGILSGLSDEGEVAFLVGFDSGIQAIVRATVNRGTGTKYSWSGEAGNNQWFGKSGTHTNWKDENGVNWSDPPGKYGKEIVTIDPGANVVLDGAQADIGRLDAYGSLEVRQDLYLHGVSDIENLTLDHGADIWLSDSLGLDGTMNVWADGNFKDGAPGTYAPELGIYKNASLRIPASDTASRTIEVPLLNYGTVEQAGTITTSRYIEDFGQFTLSGNADVNGTFQLEDGGALTRAGSGVSQLKYGSFLGGTLTIEPQGTLVLQDTLWEDKTATVEVKKDAVLRLGPNDNSASHLFAVSSQVITGAGTFEAQNAQILLTTNHALSLHTANARIIDGLVGLTDSSATPDARPRLTLTKDAVLGIQPVVTMGWSGETTTPLALRSVVLANSANLTVQRQLLLENTEFYNSALGVINLDTASLLGSELTYGTNVLINAGTINLSGIDKLGGPGDDIQQNGTLHVLASSDVEIKNTSTLDFQGYLLAGTWEVDAGSRLRANDGFPLGSIEPTASVKLTGSGSFNNLPGAMEDLFRIGGTLILKSGANATSAGIVQVLDGGTLDIDNARLTVTNKLVLDSGSHLFGRLDVSGNVENRGDLSPGHSPGAALISGDYEQTATGSLEIQLGGPDPGTNYDQLIVSGTATLGGTLVIQPWNGFIPAPGQSFDVLVANSISGTFSNIVTEFGGRRTFDVALGPQGVSLTAQASAVASFAQWQQAEFTAAELQDASVSGPDADPDGDGIVNFAEYALGLSAKVADSNPILPMVQIDPGTGDTILTLTFPWGDNMGDAQYQVQTSEDLKTWKTTPAQLTDVVPLGGLSRLTLQLPPVSDAKALFARLQVSAPEP